MGGTVPIPSSGMGFWYGFLSLLNLAKPEAIQYPAVTLFVDGVPDEVCKSKVVAIRHCRCVQHYVEAANAAYSIKICIETRYCVTRVARHNLIQTRDEV
jgi:hypothetical protein